MNNSHVKEAAKINTFAMVGPASVLISVLLLVIKQSPFYIDLSVIALTGLMLAWRFDIKGLLGATALLSIVLGYDVAFEGQSFSLWEFGLSLSIEMAFFATALAQGEVIQLFQKTKQNIENRFNDTLQNLEDQNKVLTSTKKELEIQVASQVEKLIQVSTLLKSKTEAAELFERLLSIARKELVDQIKISENFENGLVDSKRTIKILEESIFEMQKTLSFLSDGIDKLQESLADKESVISTKENLIKDQEAQLKTVNQQLMDMQHATDLLIEKEKLLISSQDQIHTLTDQLGKLTDQLNELQSEKDKLEKELDEVLQPKVENKTSTERRIEGMYHQLKNQFAERAQILANTRHELFVTQEKLLTLEKTFSEETQFDLSGQWHIFEKHFLKLSQELIEKEKEIIKLEELLSQSLTS